MPDFTDNLKPKDDGSAILKAERDRSPISTEELSRHLFSKNGFLERQQRVLRVLEKEPLFQKKQQLNLARPDRYHLGLARAKALRRFVVREGWDVEDYRMAEYLTDEMSPYHLHFSMFATTIKEQASPEQKAYWWPKVESFEIIGAYAQTELGHGSNVRGLECEARYDPNSKEFILHSPTLTSSKWWNGSMGRTATHAIVMAQLLLPQPNGSYKSFGPQPFIVQIREKVTHEPVDGVVVGDIGPKYGYTSMDNGFMLFDKLRVPHTALLSRYAKVDPETGAFRKEGHPGVVYGSLTNVRANIVMHARLVLARAVTIAIRYTSIRRQFRDRDAADQSGPEMAVLDYPTVQIRLLPLLATAFALHYTGEAMHNLYNNTRNAIEEGNFDSIAELHSTSSGLKSLCTTYAADGIETCRRSMGGHGFGGGSGLIGINNDYLSKPTVEGDNWMITQQVAAYLIKIMTDAVSNPKTKSADATEALFRRYLAERGRRRPAEVLRGPQIDNGAIVDAFQWRAAEMSFRLYDARIVQKKKWNSLLIQLHRLSNVYSQMILVNNFYAALQPSPLSAHAASVMESLFQLYALYTMDTDARTFSTTLSATPSSLDVLPDIILDLMIKIRPHAVKLVDGWAIPDYVLDSALGRYDGRVYEDLFDRAHRQNPLNRTTFNVDWQSEEIVLGSGDAGKNILAKL
ncbi:acyl-CoA oxidase [Trichodelitschia bisporula]|uniref:Acyl-coenzyme A oxidase n=1 Tax=Trichodelitschia bisporula TaxID=703511 RepID=A0A6G1HUF7_9PEZI|nr:acyl-CoA oxidase [Trichodelitschia bisporula]